MTTSHLEPFVFSPQTKQRRPGPVNPPYAIPRDQWPNVMRRVEQGETYRQIAQDYQTSYQSIYRLVKKLRNQHVQGGES
ncbi:MAG TPA: helix-turn-helix domain-containing protein [Ktedonobacteraceae bacterium]